MFQVDLLLSELLWQNPSGKSANIEAAFHSTSVDIITSYCFGHSYNTLTAPKFEHPIIVSMQATLPLLWYFKQFPFTKYVILRISDWLPETWLATGLIDMRRKLSRKIDAILADPELLQTAEHETVFHHLVTPLPATDQHKTLSKDSLLNEATNLMFAGSDTVANICKVSRHDTFGGLVL